MSWRICGKKLKSWNEVEWNLNPGNEFKHLPDAPKEDVVDVRKLVMA